MIKHFQITQSNKFAISLQYLKVRSQEVKLTSRNGGHFWHADKCQNFYKLALYFLKEVARHVQNTQYRKLVVFLQYIKKNCWNCFVFYCDAKHSDILWGSSHACCQFFKVFDPILFFLKIFLTQCALGYQPPSEALPPLSCQATKSINCPAPFLSNLPYILVFCETST